MLIQLIPFAIILSLLVPAQSELISVVQVFRHGQRAPVSFYTNDPYSNESYWTASAGQLTKTGMNQHYALGQFTRQRYGDWLGSFSVDTFRAQSTDIDRTHMSAQSNIAGLFPPTENQIWNENILWQPIPIHPTDTEVLSASVSCTAYTEELARVMDENPYYTNIDERYTAVYEYLTQNTGDNITTLMDVSTAYDSLFIENDVGYELPSWATSVFPEPLTTLDSYVFQALAFNTKLRRLSSGVFIDTIINHFDTMLNSTSTPKYQMYSAHDTNIAQILSALGAFKPHAPYFASTIYIELHESSEDTYINIYHKNKDVFEKIHVGGCEFDCPLSKFKVLMKKIRLDADTWETECAQTTNYTVSATVKNLLAHQDPNGPGHKLGI